MMETFINQMTVKSIMVPHPVFIAPGASLQDAALKMRDFNCGVLPVGTAEKVEGMITDRDIVIRALVNGKNQTRDTVKNFMTPEVIYCHENDPLDDAVSIMQDRKVGRLMVKDNDGQVIGILSVGNLIRHNSKGKEIAAIVKRAVKRKAA